MYGMIHVVVCAVECRIVWSGIVLSGMISIPTAGSLVDTTMCLLICSSV